MAHNNNNVIGGEMWLSDAEQEIIRKKMAAKDPKIELSTEEFKSMVEGNWAGWRTEIVPMTEDQLNELKVRADVQVTPISEAPKKYTISYVNASEDGNSTESKA